MAMFKRWDISVRPWMCAQVFQGLLERDTTLVMNVTGRERDTMDILVENMGRVNFGSKINDYKVRCWVQLRRFS